MLSILIILVLIHSFLFSFNLFSLVPFSLSLFFSLSQYKALYYFMVLESQIQQHITQKPLQSSSSLL